MKAVMMKVNSKVREDAPQDVINAAVLSEVRATRGDMFKELTDKEAVDVVQTMLYKKEFNPKEGQGVISQGLLGTAKWLEDIHKENPVLKLVGQLFVRTPIWVFHESVKLTPGLNALLPTFRADLGGANGVHRQARARTEAAASLAILHFALLKSAEGELRGNPEHDYKLTSGEEQSGLDPFNFQLGNSVFDYRRFDPLQMPITLIANTVATLEQVQYEKNTGQIPADPSIQERAQKNIGIAFGMLLHAYQNAALLESSMQTFDTLGKLSDNIGSGEYAKGVEQIGTFGGKRAAMLIPSIIKKSQIALMGKDELLSIFTVQQRMLSMVDPGNPILPRKYDALGNFRRHDNPINQLLPMVAPRSINNPNTDRTPLEQKVIDGLAVLEQKGFGSFATHQTKAAWAPDDLRNVFTTVNGRKISVYDATMLEYQSNNSLVVRRLSSILDSSLSEGSPEMQEMYGKTVVKIKKTLREHKERALEKVIQRDDALKQMVADHKLRVGRNKRGLFDLK
jgi:hypothetical protein